jgi:hypothetical protein
LGDTSWHTGSAVVVEVEESRATAPTTLEEYRIMLSEEVEMEMKVELEVERLAKCDKTSRMIHEFMSECESVRVSEA